MVFLAAHYHKWKHSTPSCQLSLYVKWSLHSNNAEVTFHDSPWITEIRRGVMLQWLLCGVCGYSGNHMSFRVVIGKGIWCFEEFQLAKLNELGGICNLNFCLRAYCPYFLYLLYLSIPQKMQLKVKQSPRETIYLIWHKTLLISFNCHCLYF